MKRYYYAMHNPFGKYEINADGTRARELHRFETARIRDGFVANDPNRCETVKASHPAVRQAKRKLARMPLDWPIEVSV
jgi:hypothetical protein